MEKAQRDALLRALKSESYSVARAAQRLRIGRSTVYRLIDRYQISLDSAAQNAAPRRTKRTPGTIPSMRGKPAAVITFDGNDYRKRSFGPTLNGAG